MKCPLLCGQCCEFWKDVPELAASAPKGPFSDCPHLGREGCRLPRSDRPDPCTEYLCGVAKAVLRGQITHEVGVYCKERGMIDVWCGVSKKRAGTRR